MSIESELYSALKGLVSNRVHRSVFPQPPATPVWPAIRFTMVSGTNAEDISGTGDLDTDDVLYQIDIVAETFAEVDSLTAQVVAAMQAFPRPNSRTGRRADPYDPVTKTERVSLDYLIQQSSP